MVDYDETIPPGGEGKINVKIDTKGYGQGTFKKTVRIYTNDPKSSIVTLAVKASIKVLINISPKTVTLSGFEGDEISKTVTVTGYGDTPLELEPKVFSLEGKVAYQIETVEKGKTFKIRFKNVPGPAGKINGALTLKTNYPEKPKISILIKGTFRKKAVKKDNDNDKKSDLQKQESL